ncbi:uncharacterized protein J4E87_003289 [Alternaria ethzedia]|uniref:uncharacterized protein n=1 Tax=Alternaria ethzedia TaxID=181014 RepID=UPI0020C53319|nr:uncharacterized protein J4E87_003289 [Alternaria ethzedia]KAI4629029.1 hypothetical protein J4E87_003289 [Alternaria ethzedia]
MRSLVDDFIADLEVSGQLGDNGGQGWMTVISNQVPDKTFWPDMGTEKNPYVYIYYCFATNEDFDALHDVVDKAANEWLMKLGRGSDNGHRFVGFRHYHDADINLHPRCVKDDKWNDLVPEGTLVIKKSVDGGVSATIGFIPETHMHLVVATRPADFDLWKWEVVHEFGHVLGFEHEHQRKDRDDFVNFDCSKLEGYETAKQKVETEPAWEGKTIEDVCGSNFLGYMHGLHFIAPTAYCTDMGLAKDDRTPLLQYSETAYDHDSIMQYPSQAFAANQRGAVNEVPLVRWKNGRPSDGSGPNDENAQYIPNWKAISDGDKRGIQHYYPYLGPTENEQNQDVQDVGVWG